MNSYTMTFTERQWTQIKLALLSESVSAVKKGTMAYADFNLEICKSIEDKLIKQELGA